MSAYNHGGKYPQEAVESINELLMQIQALYEECKDIAVQFDIAFTYSGPAGYGDGGYFDPEDHWTASSQSC